MASAGAMANEPKPAPLVIQEQGSFAVGGTMTQSPGTFDPYKPTAPRARRTVAITPTRSIKCR
jgi:hypothetical protein